MAKKIAKKPTKVTRDALGAGIGAIFNRDIDEEIKKDPENVVKTFSSNTAMIPITSIEVNPNQPRNHFDEEALQELSDSIKIHGLIQPITVRRLDQKTFQLISGERRWRASKMAGLEEVPAYIRIANDQEMLEMALIENIQREDLNAVEIALTYQRLKEECGLTDEKLSERVGKKRTTVTNYMRLLSLPPSIQTAIKSKTISMGHARALAGVEDYGMQNALLQQTTSKGLSVRALEKLVSDYNSPKPKKEKQALPTEYKDVEQAFREYFGMKRINIKVKDGGKGQIVIPFDSVLQLNQILDRIDDD